MVKGGHGQTNQCHVANCTMVVNSDQSGCSIGGL